MKKETSPEIKYVLDDDLNIIPCIRLNKAGAIEQSNSCFVPAETVGLNPHHEYCGWVCEKTAFYPWHQIFNTRAEAKEARIEKKFERLEEKYRRQENRNADLQDSNKRIIICFYIVLGLIALGSILDILRISI